MDPFSRISTNQRANLIAYLDGELDEEESADIERLLSKSSVARNDVELLARTYDLLDNLPRYQATEAFTERTVASIRLEEIRPALSQTVWFQTVQRGARPLLWGLLLIASSTLGYLAAQRWVSNPADMLARDFEVIQKLDVYQEVGDPEFLKELDRNPELIRHLQEQANAPPRR